MSVTSHDFSACVAPFAPRNRSAILLRYVDEVMPYRRPTPKLPQILSLMTSLPGISRLCHLTLSLRPNNIESFEKNGGKKKYNYIRRRASSWKLETRTGRGTIDRSSIPWAYQFSEFRLRLSWNHYICRALFLRLRLTYRQGSEGVQPMWGKLRHWLII